METQNLKRPKRRLLLLAACVSVVGCNSLLRALPGPHIETPKVSPELEQRVRNLQPSADKAILYVYQIGNRDSSNFSDVYVGDDYLGRISPGFYLFAIIEPKMTRLKSEIQIRYSDRRQSYPVAYHYSWDDLNIRPGQKYFVLLQNDLHEFHTADQYEQAITSYYGLRPNAPGHVPPEFELVELRHNNVFDIDSDKFKYTNPESCEFGAGFERRTYQSMATVPCSFDQSF